MKNQSSTVIVIDHEDLIIRVADALIEVDPQADAPEERLVFQAIFQALMQSTTNTAEYLNDTASVSLLSGRHYWCNRLQIYQAILHKVQQLTVSIPPQCINCGNKCEWIR